MEAGEAMVSDLFMKDYRQMSAQGVEFTPADIIRLNALAVKVKLAARPVGAVHLRRAVFWGDLAFREPTLGHDMWIERVGTFIDLSADCNYHAIVQLTMDGEKVREWNSAHQAEKATNIKNIRQVVLGLRKSAGGYRWEFLV